LCPFETSWLWLRNRYASLLFSRPLVYPTFLGLTTVDLTV
jgi:hypothetical protein